MRVISGAYVGENQAKGSDSRLVRRYGGDSEFWWANQRAKVELKLNDWGPYDYHRVFNLTYPIQLNTDYSVGIFAPTIDWASTRLGVQTKFRTRDDYSPGYEALPEPVDGLDYEWEVGSYLNFGM